MMSCMLKLNATVWQQKLRLRWLGHMLRMKETRISKKGLRWNPPGKRKQRRPKMTIRKTFNGDFKKMEPTCGTAEREAKREFHGEKGMAALSLMNRCNE